MNPSEPHADESAALPAELVHEAPPPRRRRAERDHLIPALRLEELLTADHQARVVWQFVQGVDLTSVYASIRAVEGGPGRPAIDPRILVALWLYATLEGVGSARALDYLCTAHHAFRWLCGGVSVNYHTLADFRVAHLAVVDAVLTHSVATLREQDLVELTRVAQDGRRVRASAGAASFRRRPTLEQCLQEAQAQVQRLRTELTEDPGHGKRRQAQAQQRAAREREERIRKALARLPELAAKKKAGAQEQARSSTTDAEATVRKMADGGFRPAYNVEFSTDTATQIIVGVDVITAGSDQGQLPPMVEQIHARFAQYPGAALVDGGVVNHADIDTVSAPDTGCTVYAPVPKPKDAAQDRYAPRPTDSAAVAAWRQRMATTAAQAIYKDRAATAECVNALARNRGLRQVLVRGVAKVKAFVLWYAVAHNVARALSLRTSLAMPG